MNSLVSAVREDVEIWCVHAVGLPLPSGLLLQLKNTIGEEEIPVWEAIKAFIQDFRSPSPREASGFDLGEGWVLH